MSAVALLALAGMGVAVLGAATGLQATWVAGRPDAWTVVVRHGQVVRAGVGISGFVRPTDQVVTFTAAVQRVRFAATFVDADLLQVQLTAFALWSVEPDDPLRAYRRLGLVNAARQPSGHLLTNAQFHAFQQALAALVRRHGGGHRFADLARDPAPLLAAVHADASRQLGALGVVVEDVQLLAIDAADAEVVKALAAPAEEVVRREAEVARDTSRRARAVLEAEAVRAKALADVARQIAIQAEQEQLAELRREAAARQLKAELLLAHERAEAEVARVRLATEVAQEKGTELRAHELAVLQTTKLADAVGSLPLTDARVVHVGDAVEQLARWLKPAS